MSVELGKILNEAIPRWVKLTGTKLGSNKHTYHVGSSSKFQDGDLQRYVKDLNDAREMDVSGVTAILYLRGLFEDYVKEMSFQAHTLLYNPDHVQATLDKLREFHTLIDQPCCREAVEAFRVGIRTAATHYGYDVIKLKKHLADEGIMGELRLAASRSLERLDVHQFLQGTPDPKPLQYNHDIYEFSNINSFVAALHRQWVSGITLALIRGGDVFTSYFVLGLRNGETLTILTDFTEGAHPEYHNMTRRPDRRLEERARLHWFPYRLVDDKPKQKQVKDKTALVAMNAKAVSIEEISNLEPTEFLWLTLLFDRIADRFGREDFKTAEVSYTGEMVVTPHALVDAQSALVVAGKYQPLVLPRLTVETATAKRADNKQPNGFNAWMEERYRDRVPDAVLDVVGDRIALEVGKAVAKQLPGKVDSSELPRKRRQPNVITWGGSDARIGGIDLAALAPTYFGTKGAIDRDRSWYARQNMMKVIQRLATVEFASKQALILSWFRKRLERNMSFLLKAVIVGELTAPTTQWASRGANGFPNKDKLIWKNGNILRRSIAPNWWKAFPGESFGEGISFGEWIRPHVTCALDAPHRATVFAVISPDNPKAIALLAGIPDRKLPWPLRHWTTREPYTGNSILGRMALP